MNNLPSPKAALSRRKFLGTALAGTTATLAGAASMSFFSTEPAFAQSNLTPDEALKALLDGNERSASGRLSSLDQDLKILRDHTVYKQEPFAAVLSCADSQVPVELIFDQTIGQIFVARVAGNVVTPEIIGSLEYGAAVLGTKVGQTRWLTFEQESNSASMPVLFVVTAWLTITFISFGLFAPRNAVAIFTLFVCATAVSGAIFLTLELYSPLNGLIRISSEPLRNVILRLGQ